MLFPIRGTWFSRPGWSEFTARREDTPNQRHNAFDIYAAPGTPIYASGPGVVTRKGFHAGGHGWWVAVQYEGYELSYSHNQADSLFAEGARVTSNSILAPVGDTGSARGYDWIHPTAGRLQHVHVEARRGKGLSGTLVDPLPLFSTGGLAGGGGTPVTIPLEDDMPVLVRRVGEATLEWSLFSPSLRGASTNERGYIVTTNQAVARGWARTYASGFGNEKSEPRSVYVEMQAAARVAHDAYQRGLPASGGGSVDLKPVLDAIGKVPTAKQNGVAARAEIVK